MSNKKKGRSIVAINRFTEKVFSLNENYIEEYDISKSNKDKEFYITYIPYKNMQTSTIEINKDIPDEDISNLITIKTYEDMSLDANKDYKITYTESPSSDSESRFYNVFVIDNAILNADLSNIANNTHYIDYVAATPFLIDSLYKKNIISPDSVDCFIYIQNNDAFLAIYQNGEYFDSRPLRYSLNFICDKFSQAVGEKVDNTFFYEMLSKQGITLENPTQRDALISILDDMFTYLNDVITNIQKINGLNINNVYFGSDIGHIKGIDIFVEDKLGITFKKFECSIAINQKDFKNITTLDILMFLTAQVYLDNKNDDYNYSNFLRPPPLFKRNSGKLLMVVVLSIIAGLAIPAYLYGYGMINKGITAQKTNEYGPKHSDEQRIKATLIKIQSDIDKTKEESKVENEFLNDRKKILSTIHDKKVNYSMKSVAIYDMVNMINKKNGILTNIQSNDNNMSFTVRTQTEKTMTELLRNISETKKYIADTKSILLDENNDTIAYESNITIGVAK